MYDLIPYGANFKHPAKPNGHPNRSEFYCRLEKTSDLLPYFYTEVTLWDRSQSVYKRS